MILPNHQFIRLLKVLRRDWGIQFPGDIHRLLALVLDVVSSTEIGVCLGTIGDPVGFELTNK